MKFVLKGPTDNNPALVEIMAWRRIGDKPLSEPMLTRFTDAYMRHSGEMSQWRIYGLIVMKKTDNVISINENKAPWELVWESMLRAAKHPCEFLVWV